MSLVPTNNRAKPPKVFDKIGYQKQLIDSELGQYERQVLTLMATYALPDGTLPFKAFNGATIGDKIRVSSSTVGRVLKGLKGCGMLKKVTRKGRKHWVLPSETDIVKYSPRRK